MMHYKGLAKLAAKEAKNRALLICETAGMLSLLGEKWAYSAQVDGPRAVKATPLMYGSTMLWQARDRQIIGLPEDAQAAVTMTREATTDALGTVMRFDTPEETFTAQTLENAAAMWQALAMTSWVAWDDD